MLWETRLEFEMLGKSEINKPKFSNKENPVIRKYRSNVSTENKELTCRQQCRRKKGLWITLNHKLSQSFYVITQRSNVIQVYMTVMSHVRCRL